MSRKRVKFAEKKSTRDLDQIFAQPVQSQLPVVVGAPDELPSKLFVTAPGLSRVQRSRTVVSQTVMSKQEHLAEMQRSAASILPPSASTAHFARPASVKSSSSSRKDRPILIFAGIAVVAMSLWFSLAEPDQHAATENSLTARANSTGPSSATADRIDYYRKSTSLKIERDRIDSQIANERLPTLNNQTGDNADALATASVPPNVMSGLPLVGESHWRTGASDRLAQPRPSDLDQAVMKNLKDEQDRVAADLEERRAYIREFVANAKRDGYDVRIDEEGNVQFQPIRKPSSQR
jgi:hypothetical protein